MSNRVDYPSKLVYEEENKDNRQYLKIQVIAQNNGDCTRKFTLFYWRWPDDRARSIMQVEEGNLTRNSVLRFVQHNAFNRPQGLYHGQYLTYVKLVTKLVKKIRSEMKHKGEFEDEQ